MFKKILPLLIFGSLFFAANCKLKPDYENLVGTKNLCDSIITITSSLPQGANYNFYYIDEYLNNIQSVLTLNKTTKIISTKPVMVYEGLSPKYLFFPGDSITFKSKANGQIFAQSDNKKCNLFLDFQNKFSSQFPNIYPFDPEVEKIIVDGSFEKVVKGLDTLLRKQIGFLNASQLDRDQLKKYENHLRIINSKYLANAYYYYLTKGFAIDNTVNSRIIENSLSTISDMKTGAYRAFYAKLYEIKRKESPKESSESIIARFNTDSLTKDYVRLFVIKTTLDSFSESQKMLYADFFQNLNYKEYYSEKYLQSNLVTNKRTELFSFLRATVSFDSILNSLKGKIIYIDLWASWCLPCRREMIKSKELRANEELKDIQFVYLSVDEDFKSWNIASIDENLDTYPLNFLIKGAFESPFAKKIKLSEIPRYLIFDKIGRLVNDDSPAPGDKEILQILKRLKR